MENILYLGGPNIASEIYNKEYANARICGAEKWRKPLAKFLRQPHFIVWDNSDLVTHEVMGGLKNVYAIGAGKLLFLYDGKGSLCLKFQIWASLSDKLQQWSGSHFDLLGEENQN